MPPLAEDGARVYRLTTSAFDLTWLTKLAVAHVLVGVAMLGPDQGQAEVFAMQAVPVVHQRYIGVWKGAVTQPGRRPYEVVMTLTEVGTDSLGGSVDYTALGCGGSLSMISISDTMLVLQERIVRGRRACVDGIRIKTRVADAGTMRWEAFYPSGALAAWATVTRVTPATVEAPVGKQAAEEAVGAAIEAPLPLPVTFLVGALAEWANAQANAFGKFCNGEPDPVARELVQSVWKVSQGVAWTTPDEFGRRVLDVALTDWIRSVPARFTPPFGSRVVKGVRELYMSHYDPAKRDDGYVREGPFLSAFRQAHANACKATMAKPESGK